MRSTPAGAAVTEAEVVVQRQLDAYNRRDIDAFVGTYASGIKIYNFPDTLLYTGTEQLREEYGEFFAMSPNLNARILNRTVQGNFVIDQEHVTGLQNGIEIRATAIYEVRDGMIQNVWFIR